LGIERQKGMHFIGKRKRQKKKKGKGGSEKWDEGNR